MKSLSFVHIELSNKRFEIMLLRLGFCSLNADSEFVKGIKRVGYGWFIFHRQGEFAKILEPTNYWKPDA